MNISAILTTFDNNNNLIDEHIVNEGDDVASVLGITKYEPVIPTSMSGDVYNAGRHLIVNFDVENYKKYPSIIKDGTDVVMTEKLHGTFFGIGLLPLIDHNPIHIHNKFVLFSKGLGSQGLCFKRSSRSESTVYLRAAEKFGLFDILESMNSLIKSEHGQQGVDHPLFILGEVFGAGIQDNGWYPGSL